MKKKLTAAIAAAMLITVMIPTTAFAHGHGRGGHNRCSDSSQTSYALCSVDGCETSGTHWHDDTCYSGHYRGDGHSYHDYNHENGNCGGGHCH